MKKPQAMMFYPEAWKGSTGVAAMAPAARAGYFDILCSIWLSGGSLPDDDRTLQACSRLEAKDWKRHRNAIRAELVVIEDGRISQRRVIEEYERTVDLIEKRKEAAEARWAKVRSKKAERSRKPPKNDASAHANALQAEMQKADFAYETETETETYKTSPSDEGDSPQPPARPSGKLKAPEPERHPFGEFGNARLSQRERENLDKALGSLAADYISRFDRWVAEAPDAKMSGVRRRDRKAYPSILQWFDRDQKEKQANGKTTQEQRRDASRDAIREALAEAGDDCHSAGWIPGAVPELR